MTNKSVNDLVEAGFPQVPNIAANIIKAQFNLTNTVGNISNFYMNHHLDVPSTLLSGVFLQSPEKGSIYPTLDLSKNAPLEIFLYTGQSLASWTQAV